ncbi:MAG: hypothetical protein HJJLKODD_02987 [Phycisphaerae bacterium]|nr:hypothetical protein [Phycisphaerae bacterium]
MIQPRLVLCNGAPHPTSRKANSSNKIIKLASLGPKDNVHINMEDVAKVFLKHLTPRLADFLDIAAFVFSADCGTRRGVGWEVTCPPRTGPGVE